MNDQQLEAARQTLKIIACPRKCSECGRVFDLFDQTDFAEWTFGHDCE